MTTSPKPRSAWERNIWWAVLGLFLLLVLTVFVDHPSVLIAGGIIVGWIAFLIRVPTRIELNPSAVATGIGCLIGVVILGHLLARWLWRQTRAAGDDSAWRWRWTLASVALFVAMFVCGIGATGAVHQATWMARSPARLFHYPSRETANRVKCGSNMRQLGHALTLYAQAHGGKLPDSLATLLHDDDVPAAVHVCPSSNAEPPFGATVAERIAKYDGQHSSYVYHGRGLTLPLPEDRPILCEPLLNHQGDGANILFGDLHVEWTPPDQVANAMSALR